MTAKTKGVIAQQILDKIKSNNNKEITADILQNILTDINDSGFNILSSLLSSLKYNEQYTLESFMKALIPHAGTVFTNSSTNIIGNFSVSNLGGGDNSRRRIFHNLGHTDYICLGTCLSTGTAIKFNCYGIANNYCDITTSDDSSENYANVRIIIIDFTPLIS